MTKERKLQAVNVDQNEIVQLRKSLQEVCATKNKLEQTLEEKPFLPLSLRKKFKQNIKLCESKISQIRSRLTMLEVYSNLTEEKIANSVIPKHYQDRK